MSFNKQKFVSMECRDEPLSERELEAAFDALEGNRDQAEFFLEFFIHSVSHKNRPTAVEIYLMFAIERLLNDPNSGKKAFGLGGSGNIFHRKKMRELEIVLKVKSYLEKDPSPDPSIDSACELAASHRYRSENKRGMKDVLGKKSVRAIYDNYMKR